MMKKISVPIGATVSSPMDHFSSVYFSLAQKQSGQEVHKLMKEAVASTAKCYSTADFPIQGDNSIQTDVFESKKSTKASGSQNTKRSVKKAVWHDSAISADKGQVMCIEVSGRGSQWKYFANNQEGVKTSTRFHLVDAKTNQNPLSDLVAFIRSCVVPEGYPDSVSPSYTPYMRWRALKYFFGGAISVFTTRSLLHAVGVSRGATSTSVAANWVIKDGAGRVGKMLFARHGKKFDCDMKQLRFMGDLLMEFGAAIELGTAAAPHLFLPLACAANIAKNVAAVTSTSTRAPIYKAFARGENIGDITAKGECISNVADLVGTGLGIFMSKKNPSLLASFMVLSCGYLCCSYQEIKSVLLPTLNRARFGAAVQSFLQTGQVPSLAQGNLKERIITLPWSRDKPCVLGARVHEAFENPQQFLEILPLFQKENYLVMYNARKRRAYVVLKEKAKSDDVLRATFHAHLLVNILQSPVLQELGSENLANTAHYKNVGRLSEIRRWNVSNMSAAEAIAESFKHASELFEAFRDQATSQGWMMAESLLNPGSVRLRAWKGN